MLIETIVSFTAMFLLIGLRVPIAISTALVGFGGFAWIIGWPAAFALVEQTVYGTAFTYEFSVIPLFVLMGNLVNSAGLSRGLYDASYAFLGHRRGGLAMSTIVACGGFSAICGSSLATAATMSKVAMPSMRAYKYDDGLAAASIAAGGTLGILIPPSVILVLYGVMTETSIGQLFAAGLVPGLIGVLLYIFAVLYVVRRDPTAGPCGKRTSWTDRIIALRKVWGALFLFVLVIGGIYAGFFTPTEAAGIGAAGALALAVRRQGMDVRRFALVLFDSARTTAMLFAIVIGALLFANLVNLLGVPAALISLVSEFSVSPPMVILAIICIYILLGCVLESLSMLLLTVPVFFPLISELGFDLVWFGILVVIATEISLITPPIGLNVFVIRSAVPGIPLWTVFRGVVPFWMVDMLRLGLIASVPGLALFLPRLLF